MLLCLIEASMAVVRVTVLRLVVCSLGGHYYGVVMKFPFSFHFYCCMSKLYKNYACFYIMLTTLFLD